MNATWRRALVVGLLWLLLANSLAPGQALLALILALLAPLAFAPFLPAPGALRLAPMLRLAARVAWDIVVASVQVAWIVAIRPASVRPGFVQVPLELTQDRAVDLLAAIVTMTPGTLSAGIDPARRVLTVHALVADDPDALRRDIKQRYESLLLEAFPC